jgi:hypothetical protein
MENILNLTYSNPIIVQTRKGNNIENAQYFEVSYHDLNMGKKLEEQYRFGVTRRTEPSPIYNCHGMTFASRRTWIFETDDINLIIKDDQYIEITAADVLAGDVILYFSDSNDIEHSGIVVIKPKNENLNIPVIISKWGIYCEFIHAANCCPYNYQNVKYYRIKK